MTKMIVGSNQPYLFPYIGYWKLMNASEVYVISDSMQYIKKGYINRNSILLNKQKHLFSLEVLGVHGDSLINEVTVGSNARKIVNTFKHAYQKAPFFTDVYPLIEEILLNDEKNLAKYLGNSIEKIAHYLDMKTTFIYLSELQGKTSLKAQARTIDICKRANATHYINAIGGQDLYDQTSFESEGIKLSFLDSKGSEYKQYYNEFIPNLSIVDVMMFKSKNEVKKMLNQYELV